MNGNILRFSFSYKIFLKSYQGITLEIIEVLLIVYLQYCVWMRYLKAGFEEKPKFDKGIYQFHRFGSHKRGNCKFPHGFLAGIWGSHIPVTNPT